MRQGGSKGCSAASAAAAAASAEKPGGLLFLFFSSVLFTACNRRGYNKEGERCCLILKWKKERKKRPKQKGGVGDAGWQVESSRRLDATGGGLRVARLRRGGGYRRRERWGNARRAGREIAKVLYGE